MPVFDFHARLPRTGTADLLAAMDAAGVHRCGLAAGGLLDLDSLSRHLVTGGRVRTGADNAAVLRACADTDQLVPFYFGNPHTGADEYSAADGFRALEISPAVHGEPFTAPGMLALVAIAAQRAHPVYTVCVDRPGARVADLAVLANRYPRTPFVLGHLGIGLIDTYAVDLVADTPNILVETSGAFTVTVRAAIDRLGAHRVLFAAEYPLQPPAVELAKYAALDLSPPTRDAICWHNANRLLGEPCPPDPLSVTGAISPS